MRAFPQIQPLTDAELDRLGDFLESCKGGNAMKIEQLDGFFSALIAGPTTVMPSEYYPEVFGGEMSDTCQFGSLEEASDILELMMRHWNTIAATLHKGEFYVPLLLEDENNLVRGNDWAHGYIRGVDMRREGWAQLVNDEEHGGYMVPVFMLHHENDDDPEMRPQTIGPGQRDDVIAHMAAGLLGAYKYFRSCGGVSAEATFTHEPRPNAPKIARNDLCPCGSGKKYKRCCGGATIN
jgi:uncharacterized protein